MKFTQNINVDETTNAFLNVMKNAYWVSGDLATNGVTVLNDDGYPASTLSSNLGLVTTMLPNAAADVWVLKWTGTVGAGSTGLSISNAITINTGASTGTVISGGSGGGAVVRGTNARFEFTFVAMSASINGWSCFFQSGCTFSGFSNLVLCRKADEADVDAGKLWSALFKSSISTLSPGALRMMGSFLHSGSEINTTGNWNYRIPTTALSYTDRRYSVTNAWAGVISNSGNLYTAGSFNDMAGTYQDGETFLGTVSATNVISNSTSAATSSGKVKITLSSALVATLATGDIISYQGYTTTGSVGAYAAGIWIITVLNTTDVELTTNYHTGLASVYSTYVSSPGKVLVGQMNSGGRGVRPIISADFWFTDPIHVTGSCCFVYKKPLEAWVASSNSSAGKASGIYTGISVELAVDLCNTLQIDFWWNLTAYANDAFALSAITYIRDNLSPNLNLYFEWSNEVWNSAFSQYILSQFSAIALGMSAPSPSNSSAEYSWSYQGLKFAMLVDLMKPIWTATRSASQFKTVMSNWAVSGLVAEFQTYKLKGNLLNAATNSILSTFTGGKSYNAGSPTFNRPQDKMTTLSFAPYMYMDFVTYSPYTMAQQYATGSRSTALDGMDTAMNARGNTYASTSNVYPTYETLCVAIDADRPSSMASVEVHCYEGGHQISFPQVSDYVTNTASSSATVTFTVATSRVNWTAHGLQNGCRVAFSGGTLPSGLAAGGGGNEYYVMNATANDFQVAFIGTAPLNLATPITMSGTPSGTTTATASTYSFDNVVLAWLTDPLRAPRWTRYVANQFLTFSHFKRMAGLQLQGWVSFAGTPAIWQYWGLYSTNINSPTMGTYDGLRLSNTSKRRIQW